MNILAIDTSCDSLTVVLKVDDKIYPYKSLTARQGHSVLLLSAINELLLKAGIKVSDVDYFGVVVGPGSFTGIRVGVATVNAFAYANTKPVVEVTAFESFAYTNVETQNFAIDAKHGNYYLATRENDKLSYKTLEGEELPENCFVLPVTELDSESLIAVVCNKIENGESVQYARPLYMRASEAERNKK